MIENGQRTGLRLTFEDQGPGIPDVELGAYRRLHVRKRHGTRVGRRQAPLSRIRDFFETGRRDQSLDLEVEIAVPESVRIIVQDDSQTAEARRTRARMALRHRIRRNRSGAGRDLRYGGLHESAQARGRGRNPAAGYREQDPAELEILALDRGPGMANLEQCLRDGYSTGSVPGQGLGAIMRLSSASDFYSIPGQGTAFWPAGRAGQSSRGSFRKAAIRRGQCHAKPGRKFAETPGGREQTDGRYRDSGRRRLGPRAGSAGRVPGSDPNAPPEPGS